MKFVLLAAAALIAAPAMAQTSGSTGTSSPTNTGGMGSVTDTRNASAAAQPDQTMPADQTTPADQAMPADQTMPAGQTMPSDQTMPMQQPMAGAPMGTESAGGYQPSMPAVQGTMTPGMTPVFRAAPSPSEAFPPPAPQASYPICKKGEFDNCMQGPKSTHSREVRGRR